MLQRDSAAVSGEVRRRPLLRRWLRTDSVPRHGIFGHHLSNARINVVHRHDITALTAAEWIRELGFQDCRRRRITRLQPRNTAVQLARRRISIGTLRPAGAPISLPAHQGSWESVHFPKRWGVCRKQRPRRPTGDPDRIDRPVLRCVATHATMVAGRRRDRRGRSV